MPYETDKSYNTNFNRLQPWIKHPPINARAHNTRAQKRCRRGAEEVQKKTDTGPAPKKARVLNALSFVKCEIMVMEIIKQDIDKNRIAEFRQILGTPYKKADAMPFTPSLSLGFGSKFQLSRATRRSSMR